MRPGPVAACDLIETVVLIDSPPRASLEILVEIIEAESWAESTATAFEKAEQWDERFRRRLQTRMSDLHADGRVCAYAFNSSSDYMIQGAGFVEPGVDSEELAASKLRRQIFGKHLEFLRSVRPYEFETLCRGILSALGVENPAVTPRTADEGIDFYGHLKIGTIMSPDTLPGLHTALNVWMIGQAKHYPTGQAATPEIRELVGAVELARAGAFSRVSNAYSDLEMKLCDPVFFLFFTTGSISGPGWRLLRASGVVGMDGEMIAAFLAEQGVGMQDGDFDDAAMAQWVASI